MRTVSLIGIGAGDPEHVTVQAIRAMNAADVQPLPLRELLPALLVGALLVLAVYLVQFDQGALSQSGSLLHELMHDGRHLLGVPCH